MAKSAAIIDIVWGILIVLLALKLSAVIGVFGTIAFVCAGIKIALTGIEKTT